MLFILKNFLTIFSLRNVLESFQPKYHIAFHENNH